MPIYLYQCPQCKKEFELKQSFRDKSMASCPVCHENAVRLFAPVPIIFKGPGFYVTDSRAGTDGSDPGGTAKDNGGS